MADFCKQCSIEMFGKDYGDLKLGPLKIGHGWVVLCEGCGPTMVDAEGQCTVKSCLQKHGK